MVTLKFKAPLFCKKLKRLKKSKKKEKQMRLKEGSP